MREDTLEKNYKLSNTYFGQFFMHFKISQFQGQKEKIFHVICF